MSETPSNLALAARRLRLVTLAGTLLIEALILFSAWLVLAGRQAEFAPIRVQDDDGLPPPAAAFALLLVGLLVGLALLRLARMLGRVAAGERFGGAAADLRGFSLYLFLSVLASILAPPLLQLAIAAAGEGQHRIGLALGLGDALTLLVTGLLFLVARLLDEAQRLADEHSQIV